MTNLTWHLVGSGTSLRALPSREGLPTVELRGADPSPERTRESLLDTGGMNPLPHTPVLLGFPSAPTLEPPNFLGNTHQHLEEEGQQLAVGHEGAVQDAQVEPTAQAPEDFDEHLLLIARLLHTCHLQGHRRAGQDP